MERYSSISTDALQKSASQQYVKQLLAKVGKIPAAELKKEMERLMDIGKITEDEASQIEHAIATQKTASSSDELHDLAMARMNETKGDIGRVMDELMSKHGYDVLNPQQWEEFEQEIANWWNELEEEHEYYSNMS